MAEHPATPVAHLLHGFIGSGKTSFAQRLERSSGARRFTLDEWMIERHGRNPPAAHFQAIYRALHEELWVAAIDELARGGDVILDLGFWTRDSRNEAREHLQAVPCRAQFYSLECPVEVMRQRTLSRTAAAHADALHIDAPAFEKLLAGFEPMAGDEVHQRVNTAP